jgi:hypothetical protein
MIVFRCGEYTNPQLLQGFPTTTVLLHRGQPSSFGFRCGEYPADLRVFFFMDARLDRFAQLQPPFLPK